VRDAVVFIVRCVALKRKQRESSGSTASRWCSRSDIERLATRWLQSFAIFTLCLLRGSAVLLTGTRSTYKRME
jgi:hypothetical protein